MRDLVKLLIPFIIGFAIGFWGLPGGVKNTPEPTIETRVDTLVVRDTITREKPVPVTKYVHDTVRTYFTTIQHDSVLVEVPIETRVYEEDSLYRAVVTGWRPELKELTIYPTTTTITITEKVKTKPPKFSFGLTAGPGIVITPQGQTHGGLGITAGLQYRF